MKYLCFVFFEYGGEDDLHKFHIGEVKWFQDGFVFFVMCVAGIALGMGSQHRLELHSGWDPSTGSNIANLLPAAFSVTNIV